jgi:hypothetical protein
MSQVLLGFGGGILLGLRYKWPILCPATLLVTGFMIGIGGLNWQNAVLIALVIAAMEAGYICGVFARPTGQTRQTRPGDDPSTLLCGPLNWEIERACLTSSQMAETQAEADGRSSVIASATIPSLNGMVRRRAR